MKSIKLLLLAVSITISSCYAMEEDGQQINPEPGTIALQQQLKKKDADILQPILVKLNTSAEHNLENPEPKKRTFEKFVISYVAGLVLYNKTQPKKITFNTQMFNKKFSPQEQNKSREELVKFLTTTFTDAKLLPTFTFDPFSFARNCKNSLFTNDE